MVIQTLLVLQQRQRLLLPISLYRRFYMKRFIFALICGVLVSGCSVKPTVEEGLKLQEQKKYKEAIEKYQNALEKDPNGEYEEKAKKAIKECSIEIDLTNKLKDVEGDKKKKEELIKQILLNFPDSIIARNLQAEINKGKRVVENLKRNIAAAFSNVTGCGIYGLDL